MSFLYTDPDSFVKSGRLEDEGRAVPICETADREPCHLAAARAFLRSVWHLESAQEFERFWVAEKDDRGFADYMIVPNTDDQYVSLGVNIKDATSRPSDWYFAPQTYLPGPRTDERIAQVNALVIDLDSPRLDEALDTLARHGIRPHVVTQTSPGRFQILLRLVPIRLGKRSRTRVLDRFRTVARRLTELVGGDLNAAKPGQLFRLPCSLRTIPDGIYRVQIDEQNEHAPYDLAALVQSIREPRRASFVGYAKGATGSGHVLDSPALAWIRSHRIAEGSRDCAVVALAYAYAIDGKSDTAADEIAAWAESHLTGYYPRRKVLADVAACLRNPKGLAPAILATIAAEDGETMDQATARSVFRFMPSLRQRHERKPVDDLTNRPLFERLGHVLETLAQLQEQNAGRPVTISAQSLADKSKTPLGTLTTRILPILRGTNIYRANNGTTGTYDLTAGRLGAYITHAFIEVGLFARSPARVLWYWRWRFARLWAWFVGLVRRIVSSLQCSPDTDAPPTPGVTGAGEAATPSRAPPSDSRATDALTDDQRAGFACDRIGERAWKS